MGQHVYKIARLTDNQIAHALKTLGTEFGEFSVNVSILDNGIGSVSFPASNNERWNVLQKMDSELITQFSGDVNAVSLHYVRGGQANNNWEKSPELDDLSITQRSVDAKDLAISCRVLELFQPVELPRSADATQFFEIQRAAQKSIFGRLERQLEKLYEQTIDVRRQLDEKVAEKEKALEEAADASRLAFDKEREEKLAALAKEHEALDARKKALDDSDNTFARRQIRERMLDDVSTRVKNFSVSATTIRSRVPVAIGMMFLILFLGLVFLWSSYELIQERVQIRNLTEIALSPSIEVRVDAKPDEISLMKTESQRRSAEVKAATVALANSSTEQIALWIRLSLSSIGFVASLIYYIRWQNQWAAQFASTELALQQFHLDVNRANWVVESCLEWRKENDSDIPAPLIESITRGLFTSRDTPPQVLHPADELASALFGSASKLSLDIAGNKVDFNKPGKIPKVVSGG